MKKNFAYLHHKIFFIIFMILAIFATNFYVLFDYNKQKNNLDALRAIHERQKSILENFKIDTRNLEILNYCHTEFKKTLYSEIMGKDQKGVLKQVKSIIESKSYQSLDQHKNIEIEWNTLIGMISDLGQKRTPASSKNIMSQKQKLLKMVNDFDQEISRKHASLNLRLTTLQIATGVMLLMGVLLISYIFVTEIIKPIKTLSDAALSLSKGNLVNIEHIKGHKEIENLAFALNKSQILLENSREATELATKAAMAKTEFLANMSHELRTPMHAILSFASFGLKKFDNSSKDKIKSYFNNIHNSGTRLMELLNDLFDLSSLSSRRVNYSFINCSMIELIEKVMSEHTPEAKEKYINVTFEHKTKNDKCFIDSEKIQQVISNFISNAIKYSPPNKQITVSLLEEEEDLIVQVKDNGIGVPEEELGTIFDSFVQSSSSKNGSGGKGLGLAISKQIIADHQGSIWADSSFIETVFSFKIPKLAGCYKILVVDDDKDVRDVIADKLSDEGFYPVLAENGDVAMKHLEKHKCVAAFVDLEMPKMDGIDFVIYSRQKYPKLRIVIMSGANQVDTSKLKDIGIISFIEKPLDQTAFNETLKELTRGINIFN